MAVFTGCYVGLGVDMPRGSLSEISGGSYARLAVNMTGTIQSGATQSLGAFSAAAAPSGARIGYGAVFDALTGGNQLCWWAWPQPWVSSTAVFAATVLNMKFIGAVASSVNTASGPIGVGAQLGTVGGEPLIASASLLIVSGAFTAIAQSVGSTVQNLAAIATTTTYANDTAAAAGGVPIGSIYRNGNFIMVRLS